MTVKRQKKHSKKQTSLSGRYYRYGLILVACLAAGYFSYSTVNHMFAGSREGMPAHVDSLGSDLESIDQPLENNAQQVDDTSQSQEVRSPQTTTGSNGSSGLTQWDKDGCQIGSSSYQVCRQNIFNAQCSADHSTVYVAYHTAYNPVRASYDADIKAMQQELDDLVSRSIYTTGQAAGIMNDYRHQRTQPFNAAVTPIYTTYTSAVDALNAKGCKLYTYAIGNPTLPF